MKESRNTEFLVCWCRDGVAFGAALGGIEREDTNERESEIVQVILLGSNLRNERSTPRVYQSYGVSHCLDGCMSPSMHGRLVEVAV